MIRTVLVACSVLGLAVSAQAQLLQDVGVKEFVVGDNHVVQVQTKLRYSTMIVFPSGDDIGDVVTGDDTNWVIESAVDAIHVKPSKESAATNLTVITVSGTVYSFLLNEISAVKGAQPDLKIYVASTRPRRDTPPKYVTVDRLSAVESELESARKAIAAAVAQSADAVAKHQKTYPAAMRFYKIDLGLEPFLIRGMWHDGQFTYIQSDARELPALYELLDDQPSLVNFQVDNGLYIVPKVLGRGYLAAGKNKKAHFLERTAAK